MKLGWKRPGSSTSFVDSAKDEPLLQFTWEEGGRIRVAYHLYDASGVLVADSGGLLPLAAVSVTSAEGELLLDIPADPDQHVRYRLYNADGRLLTCSDGCRTEIFGFLRMEPTRAWRERPAAGASSLAASPIV